MKSILINVVLISIALLTITACQQKQDELANATVTEKHLGSLLTDIISAETTDIGKLSDEKSEMLLYGEDEINLDLEEETTGASKVSDEKTKTPPYDEIKIEPQLLQETVDSERQKYFNDLYYKYFQDISKTGIIAFSWEEPSQIYPNHLLSFFASKTELWRLSPDSDLLIVSESNMESFIKLFFDVDSLHIRKSTQYFDGPLYYNESDKTYEVPIRPGGPGESNIVDAKIDGKILSIYFEYGIDDIVKRKGILKIEFPTEDDVGYTMHYKYISCEVTSLV